MARFVKWIAVALAIVVGAVAALFGALVVGAILLVVALFAMFGRGSVRVNVNRGPRAPRATATNSAPPPPNGDVIDIEAREVKAPRELK